ncbi:DUF6516 family protein [Thiomonas sp. FB-6]|uniref:toxin-antitoxin system TumE family protein n=1 Tax=Thiomonas sp. FB-6 TaxID=1158291 RepID=UPI0003A684C0|nr:DUF6516 family protein [Thiomonas sp. FB-6]
MVGMPAVALLHEKRAFGRGFVQIVVWALTEPVPPSEHRFKYRMVYVVDGVRIVGYDNERGKGDHRHLGNRQTGYVFHDVPTLVEDFWADVKEAAR